MFVVLSIQGKIMQASERIYVFGCVGNLSPIFTEEPVAIHSLSTGGIGYIDDTWHLHDGQYLYMT